MADNVFTPTGWWDLLPSEIEVLMRLGRPNYNLNDQQYTILPRLERWGLFDDASLTRLGKEWVHRRAYSLMKLDEKLPEILGAAHEFLYGPLQSAEGSDNV